MRWLIAALLIVAIAAGVFAYGQRPIEVEIRPETAKVCTPENIARWRTIGNVQAIGRCERREYRDAQAAEVVECSAETVELGLENCKVDDPVAIRNNGRIRIVPPCTEDHIRRWLAEDNAEAIALCARSVPTCSGEDLSDDVAVFGPRDADCIQVPPRLGRPNKGQVRYYR